MTFLPQIIAWINVPTNALGKFLLAPIGVLPGWLSNTIISAAAGVVLLIIFKYTSNQTAIGQVRDNIKANLLALKLFKDSLAVTLEAQGRIFKAALLLLAHAIRPMLVMMVPVCLLLGQMGLWYQARPLKPGEEALVTMKLNNKIEPSWPNVTVESLPSADIITGPIRVLSQHEVLWKIKARKSGYHPIVFQVENQKIEKELAVGSGYMRVSVKRPGWHWADVILYPLEKPFAPDSIVQSISIDYPARISRISGTDRWVIYFFVASLLFALLFRPVMRVRM